MENGSNGWSSTGLWHQSTLRAHSSAHSWYYGLESTATYDTGGANAGDLTSPIIDLKGAFQPVLIFRHWRQMEDVPFLDVSEVQIVTGTNHFDTVVPGDFDTAIDPLNWQIRAALLGWNLSVSSDFSTSEWVSQAVDLSPYVGERIRIRFMFGTADELFNNFEGWYIDDVNIFDAALPMRDGAEQNVKRQQGTELFTSQQPKVLYRDNRWRLQAAGDERLISSQVPVTDVVTTALGESTSLDSHTSRGCSVDRFHLRDRNERNQFGWPTLLTHEFTRSDWHTNELSRCKLT
jgi:hypothetical protein